MTRCKNAHCSRPLRLRLELNDFAEDSNSHGRHGMLSHRNWGCCCKFEFPNLPLPTPCYSDLLENSCLNESELSQYLIR